MEVWIKRLRREFRQDGEIGRNCLECRVIEEYPQRRRGNVYKAAVRPAVTYGSETCGIQRAQQDKLNVAEMRMLRWVSGYTLMNRVIRERIKVIELHQKVQEKRLG